MGQKELPMNVRNDNVSEETKILISSLPLDKDSQGNLCKYQGCWYYYNTLQAVINFQLQETDIILASFPKSGTTWLKALSVALLERSKHDDPRTHPLLSDNPHGIVPFFENDLYLKTSTPDLTKNAKDVLISRWYFRGKYHKNDVARSMLESMFDLFCRGVDFYGPVWDHALSYWRGSLENPKACPFHEVRGTESRASCSVQEAC
ncbi:unnamed protein product [Arabis nemorensis]|uniref:Sulfotransferase n=1 Tax=Arabis nemorensis TaxID=586526 RepID=A0A565CIN5_9BRAS|nr:unnamed protein product [Arabis nemorensis]